MRAVLFWSLLALTAWSIPAQADEPAAPSGAQDAAPKFTTKVQGTVPDLAGRWLVVTQVRPPQGGSMVFTVAQPWEVTIVDGQPQVVLRFVKLTPPLEEQLAAANKESRVWEPTGAQLDEVRDAWSSLPPNDRGADTVETVLIGKDSFPDAVKNDADMKDAQFLIQININYRPGAQRPIRDVLLYGVTGSDDRGYHGNYASATIAAAPVPIPIALKGTFRLYRLDGAHAPGLLRRILDMFSGCGRSRKTG